MDIWLDIWIYGWIYEYMDGYMDIWKYIWIYEWIYGYMDIWMDIWIYSRPLRSSHLSRKRNKYICCSKQYHLHLRLGVCRKGQTILLPS